MIAYKDYIAGWLDSSIHDFLPVFSHYPDSMKYVLITCLDSNLEPLSLVGQCPELAALAKEGQALGKGLLFPRGVLLGADYGKQLLFGFDELWFFPSDKIQPKPDAACLVGPARLDPQKLKEIGGWMEANSCSLALGDGEGLNFIVKARGLVRYLLGHSLDQPQPSATFVVSAMGAVG